MLQTLRDYWLLTRPRIVALVLFSIFVSMLIAGRKIPPWPILFHGLLGNGLVILGAIALNQRLERHTDAQMARTSPRPLPAGRLSVGQVTWFGVLASLAGSTYLLTFVNSTTAWLAALSWVIYVWVYTPIKPLTTWQTPVGAVAGAMPALLGAAVIGSPWTLMAVVLFGVIYFWQFPHSMAIAWLYRRQFARADLRLLTVVDPSGRMAGYLAVLGAVLLLPMSLVPVMLGRLGWSYGSLAMVLGAIYVVASVGFLLHTTDQSARRLLKVSVVYLVVLLVALTVASLR